MLSLTLCNDDSVYKESGTFHMTGKHSFPIMFEVGLWAVSVRHLPCVENSAQRAYTVLLLMLVQFGNITLAIWECYRRHWQLSSYSHTPKEIPLKILEYSKGKKKQGWDIYVPHALPT